MAAALIVSSLVMIARSFGVPATMHSIFTAYSSGSILKHQSPFAQCVVESGSSRAKGPQDMSAPSVFSSPCKKTRANVLLGCSCFILKVRCNTFWKLGWSASAKLDSEQWAQHIG